MESHQVARQRQNTAGNTVPKEVKIGRGQKTKSQHKRFKAGILTEQCVKKVQRSRRDPVGTLEDRRPAEEAKDKVYPCLEKGYHSAIAVI